MENIKFIKSNKGCKACYYRNLITCPAGCTCIEREDGNNGIYIKISPSIPTNHENN